MNALPHDRAMRRETIIQTLRHRRYLVSGNSVAPSGGLSGPQVKREGDKWSGYEYVCGYCLLPTTPETSVQVGETGVPLCNDTEVTCYELVTVYGRPLADGRRLGRFAKSKDQLELPLFTDRGVIFE